jgi:hypothetical protein
MGEGSLSGHIALVTGAAKRLGRATALALAGAGADVIVHYHTSVKEAGDVCSEIKGLGARAWMIQADLERPGEAEALIEKAFKEAGPVDILINNAAVFPPGVLADLTLDELNQNMMVNAWAPFVLSRAFAAKVKSGHIINLLDTRLKGSDPAHAAYHISKHVLALLTRLTALDLAPGVAVNAVAPGLVLAAAGSGGADIDYLSKDLPLKKVGSEADVTGAVLYLLKSGFVTGQVIYVDGGRHLRDG